MGEGTAILVLILVLWVGNAELRIRNLEGGMRGFIEGFKDWADDMESLDRDQGSDHG